MRVEYASSRAEVAGWYWHSLTHNGTHLRNWLISLLFVGAAVFVGQRAAGAALAKALGMGALTAVLAALFFALYPQLRFKPQTRILTIATEGLSTTINAKSRNYSWSEVASVTLVRGRVYIGISNGNAFVVPSRAFTSPQQQEEFLQRCSEWRANSSNPPAA